MVNLFKFGTFIHTTFVYTKIINIVEISLILHIINISGGSKYAQ